MTEYDKFLPEIPPLHAPFWAALREHRVVMQQCDRCGLFRFIPTEICSCGAPEYTWTPIAGRGEVYTYTVVHRAPTRAYQRDAPYIIGHVTMEEGPRMISTVLDCNPEDMKIGMPVEIVFDDVTEDVTLYRFRPIS